MRLTAEERLQTIKNGLPKKDLIPSESKRIAYVMPDIEAALEEGISQAAIFDALKKGGLVLAESSFKSTLSRVRKRQRGATDPVRSTGEGEPQSAQSAPAPESQASSLGEGGESKAGNDAGKNQFENIMGQLEEAGFADDHNAKFRKRREEKEGKK